MTNLNLKGIMTNKELLDSLKNAVNCDMKQKLIQNSQELIIGQANRKTMLRMLEYELDEETKIDGKSVETLKCMFEDYLDKYMADKPQGHIFIVICCLFSTFIVKEPMHPQHASNWQRIGENEYRCPYYDDALNSLCNWCVCEKL